MTESIRVKVEESSQTAEARRIARKMAEEVGFDQNRAEEIAIVVTELCTNLLKHAGSGEVVLSSALDHSDGGPCLEVLALDKGPGMDLAICSRDGYSTGSSPGQGIGAIKRLSSASDFYSVEKRGTVVLARWCDSEARGDSQTLRIGAVNVPKPGQEVCGDSWGAEHTRDSCVVMVADGLGHGYEARLASVEAVRMLHLNRELPPKALIECVHRALRSSRGAAVAVARIDCNKRQVSFAGVGNISAQVYTGSQAIQHLVSVNGTAGHETNSLREFIYPWPDQGMLVFHSDGLSSGAGLEGHPRLASRDPSVIAGVLYRDFNRGHDDVTVVVAKAA